VEDDGAAAEATAQQRWPLKVAQTWSGHKSLSVLLDTYLGSCNTSPTNASSKRTTSDPTRGKPGTLMARQKTVTRQDAD
jgi:hypothetical protein